MCLFTAGLNVVAFHDFQTIIYDKRVLRSAVVETREAISMSDFWYDTFSKGKQKSELSLYEPFAKKNI